MDLIVDRIIETRASEDFRDTEDLEGFFSGYDPESQSYDSTSWQYAGMPIHPTALSLEHGTPAEEEMTTGAAGTPLARGRPPELDPTLEHPRCVFQLLRRHFSRQDAAWRPGNVFEPPGDHGSDGEQRGGGGREAASSTLGFRVRAMGARPGGPATGTRTPGSAG